MHYYISFLYLLVVLVSCGTQKEFSKISDRIVKDYMESFNKELILTNQPLDNSLLEEIEAKYNYFKNYNSSSLNLGSSDTLKMIFSEENMIFFKSQLTFKTTWKEKYYIKHPIIDISDINNSNYLNKTIIGLSKPVITYDKKFALMRFSLFQPRIMVSYDNLTIFIRRGNKWVIYKVIGTSFLN